MAEALRDLGRVVARNSPILLTGFAGILVTHSHDRLVGPTTFGGFLTFLLVFPFALLLTGHLVQAVRMVTFDPLRRLSRPDGPEEASAYALYANLATLLAVAAIFHSIIGWERDWSTKGHAGIVLVWIFLEAGLIFAALQAWDTAAKKRPARKKTRKR